VTFDELRNMPSQFVRLTTGELALIVHWYPESDAVGVKAPNGRLHVLPAVRLTLGPSCAVEEPATPPSPRKPWNS
jgi:hypothetical protein